MSSNSINIEAGAIVCEDSVIAGKVTISKGCVVHPKAVILAENAAIVLGKNCLIEENVKIVNKSDQIMRIGNENAFEIGSVIESISIGSNNVFEVGCFVAENCVIQDNCVVGAKCNLIGPDLCFGDVCIYGSNLSVRQKIQSIIPTLALELEKLREVLPNFHNLRQSNS